ncbi:hypothetical protein KBZ94_35625 [Streptomyces sp. RM72]|uniref:hypothetical protein n=1 Tax=Streptomyces TaxID=1883 RepID=UPI001B36A3B4|nr:hypothetical protein [Streptomyces sp. RM72]MBQ0890191.1 hypothetical protein [Streptomyces sp. RM72]
MDDLPSSSAESGALSRPELVHVAQSARRSALRRLDSRPHSERTRSDQWCLLVAEEMGRAVFPSASGLYGGIVPGRTLDDAVDFGRGDACLAHGAP